VTLPRALTAAAAAATTYVLTSPVLALAATGTATTAKDPYGETTPLNLPSDTGSTHASVGGGAGSLTRTFIGLAVVVAIIYGLTWILRKSKASNSGAVRTTGFGLSAEASVPLGPNRSVHLIRAGRELVLVGSAEQGVVPIRTYTEDEARDLGLLAPEDATSDAPRPGTGGGGALRSVVERLRERTTR
jgi:flagellar protein FliO/FliZ